MKSASYTKRPPRLTRTLRRGAIVRDVQDGDIRWCYAACRFGALSVIGAEGHTTPHEFSEAFIDWVHGYDYAWMLCAPCGDEQRPVGIGLGRDMPMGYQAIGVVGIEWFPWATPRRRVEACVAWFNALRREVVMMVPSEQKDAPFFTHLARYGILRRVGTVHDVKKAPVALFQTRTPGD